MTTGEKIYRARKKSGMTQEELAERLNVSRQAVSKWESDSAYPETDKIVELCKLFDLSADELLLGEKKEETTAAAEKPKGWTVDKEHLHVEYVSKIKIGGLPLVHVNLGVGAYHAKGIIAVGNMATGLISLGFLAVGLISAGLLTAGLLAFGVIALGLLIGAGSVAMGVLACGAVAIGVFSFGGVAIGYIGVGGYAIGQYAIGGYAQGFVAVGVTGASGTHAFIMPEQYNELCEYLKEIGGWIVDFIRAIARSLHS